MVEKSKVKSKEETRKVHTVLNLNVWALYSLVKNTITRIENCDLL